MASKSTHDAGIALVDATLIIINIIKFKDEMSS